MAFQMPARANEVRRKALHQNAHQDSIPMAVSSSQCISWSCTPWERGVILIESPLYRRQFQVPNVSKLGETGSREGYPVTAPVVRVVPYVKSTVWTNIARRRECSVLLPSTSPINVERQSIRAMSKIRGYMFRLSSNRVEQRRNACT